jgi:hypothetical protein
MSPSLTRASAYTLSLAPIIALALVLVTLLPSDSRAAGSVTLVNDTFNCSSYPQPVDFDLVKVTITDQSVRRDGFHTGDNCTGRIGRLEIDVASGDGVKVGQGGHDLVIGGGYLHCNGNFGDVHQDGIQVMGGTRVTFRNFNVDCTTGTNSAMYINEGAGGNGRPTDVVCDGCVLMRGADRNRALRIGDSLRSGARNSVIVWCGTGPECGGGEAIWFSGAETDPVNQNNTIVLYRNYDGALPPPPASPPPGGTPMPSSGAPVRADRPEISGTAREGETLRTSNGTWSNSPTRYAYQWLRCDTRGDHCAPIRGATSTRLTLGREDVGDTIRVVVTAFNAAGSASAQSRATSVVDRDRYRDRDRTSLEAPAPTAPATETPEPAPTEPAPAPTEPAPAPTEPAPAPAAPPVTAPVNTAHPVITGVAQVGQTFTASAGTWSGSPTTYAYEWRRCDASGDRCDRIRDVVANLSTYVLTNDDVGHTLRVYVSASNAAGTGYEKSLKSEVVVAAADSAAADATEETAPAAAETTTSDATGDSTGSGDTRTRKR